MKTKTFLLALAVLACASCAKQQPAANAPYAYGADISWLTEQERDSVIFRDLNGNGIWDTGDYDQHLQPEPLYYYPSELALKAQWEITQDWNPTALPLAKQKPQKITKQKPDKEKTIKNRNAERQRK
jgi:hypothetical protein